MGNAFRASALAWQLADEPGPVRPGAPPRVPSVPSPRIHGDAHAEVLVGGGDRLEAAGAAEGGQWRGHVVPESQVMQVIANTYFYECWQVVTNGHFHPSGTFVFVAAFCQSHDDMACNRPRSLVSATMKV